MANIALFNQYFQHQQHDRAVAELSSVIFTLKLPAEIAHQYCFALRALGRSDDAKNVYQKYLKQYPKHPLLLNGLGNLHMYIGDAALAVTLFKQANKVASGYFDAIYNLARAYLSLNQAKQAKTYFQHALRLKPNHTNSLNGLASALQALGDIDKSIELSLQLLSVDPDNVITLNNIGNAYRESNQLNKALTHFEKAYMLAPANPEIIKNFAACLHHNQEVTRAESLYELHIEQFLENTAFQKEYANFRWMLNRDEPFKYIENGIRLFPANLTLVFMYVELLKKLELFDKALLLVKPLQSSFTNNANLHAMLSSIYLGLGDIEEALNHVNVALSLSPVPDQSLLNQFGYCLLASGQFSKAKKIYQKLIKMEPDNQGWWTIYSTSLRHVDSQLKGYRKLNNYDTLVCAEHITPRLEDAYGITFYNDLKHDLDKLHTSQQFPIEQTLRNGTQTFEDLFAYESDALRLLRESIAESVTKFLSGLTKQSQHPFLKHLPCDFTFNNSWSVRLSSRGFHKSHFHEQGWLSGVFYVEVPKAAASEGQGWLQFGKPEIIGLMDEYDYAVKPENGLLVLFPSFSGTAPSPSNPMKQDYLSLLTLSPTRLQEPTNMSNIQAHINTAMSLFNQNKFAQVVEQFSTLHKQHPMLKMLYAIALGKQQQYETAFSLMDQLHSDFPNNVDVLHNHGLLLKECGKTTLAVSKHRDTLAINPSYEPAYVALGNLLMQTEQVAAAINSFEKAFKLHSSASNLQGFTSALLKGKRYLKCIEIILDNQAFLSERVVAELFVEACYRSHNRRLIRDHYASLIAKHENSCLIGLYTGLAEIEGKRYVYAKEILKQALTLSNDETSRYEIMSNYHYVCWLIEGSTESLSTLESYLREQNNDQSKLFLHKIYEGLGRVTEAAAMLDLVSNHCKQSANTEFAKANILFRQHDLAKADSILEKLTHDNADMLNAYYLRIKVLEKMGDFAQAAHIIKEVASISKTESTLFSDTTQLTLRGFDGKASKSPRTSINSAKFIFIVGFPRSGTTLLEKELLTDKDLVLMEETDACERFFEQTQQRFNIVNWDIFLNQASVQDLNALADDYLAFLSSFVEFKPQTQVLLDKMPLNFPYLPLMLAMFPRSQVICCIRDPRDIALSCLKFEEINLYSPKAFYQAYDKVFNYALSLQSLFEKIWHEVRYEDLVKNTDDVMLTLCNSLGLKQGNSEQSETLLQTPSYYQVSQPIYTSSIGLYDSYSEFIDFNDPLLDKWLKHWDYS